MDSWMDNSHFIYSYRHAWMDLEIMKVRNVISLSLFDYRAERKTYFPNPRYQADLQIMGKHASGRRGPHFGGRKGLKQCKMFEKKIQMTIFSEMYNLSCLLGHRPP